MSVEDSEPKICKNNLSPLSLLSLLFFFFFLITIPPLVDTKETVDDRHKISTQATYRPPRCEHCLVTLAWVGASVSSALRFEFATQSLGLSIERSKLKNSLFLAIGEGVRDFFCRMCVSSTDQRLVLSEGRPLLLLSGRFFSCLVVVFSCFVVVLSCLVLSCLFMSRLI